MERNWRVVIGLLGSFLAFGSTSFIPVQSAEGETVELIPRSVLFGNPERAAARISPDGKFIGYLAPVKGVMNVWVAKADDLSTAKPITQDTERGIRGYNWAHDGKHILYTQDAKGDENWHVYATNVRSGATRDLTPFEKVNARILSVNEKTPDEILVGINNRNPQLHDVHRVKLSSGERTLIEENPGFLAYVFDNDDHARFAVTFSPTASQVLLRRDEGGNWKPYLEIPNTDTMTTRIYGFDKSNESLYLADSRDRNTSALFSWNLKTGKKTLLAQNDKSDVGSAMMHPTEKTIEAVSFTYEREQWESLDPSVKQDLEFLSTVESGDVSLTARTLDNRKWTVAFVLDDGPVKYYMFDRDKRTAEFLFSNRTDLDGFPLVKMHPQVIKSRDGLDLVSYLTLPIDSDPDADARPDQPLPMVLLVHGGPWGRDTWGYDPIHQWLANRGYAVLSVNFRSSTGFGKEFINLGNGQWSRTMHDDLVDAVRWAVSERVADEGKVAIMGGSYGGYATLAGLTFTPELFACGVDIVGPSNLVTLLENMPPYWMPIAPLMKDRVGDWTTEEGKKELLSKSPLTRADRIVRPLLIGQGANDPRVKQVESDQIVAAMNQAKIPVTYVLYPDEGHGFARPENRLSFFAVAESFLAKHLGGSHEPIGNDFEGSTIEVPSGADQVPGLANSLP